jgi:hypothetical protein
MKAKATLLVLACVFYITCNAQNASSIIGTWQLVNGKEVYLSHDTLKTFNYPGNVNGNHWKIITKSHFASIYQDTTSNSNEFLHTGFNGGTYTYINDVYTGHFTHSSLSKHQIGTSLTFKAKIEGDKLFISPLSKDGKDSKTGNFEEYKRLD